jgi:hypothetical protein
VSAINVKNKLHFSMPGIIPMVSVTFPAGRSWVSIPQCPEHVPRTLAMKKSRTFFTELKN